MRKAIPWLILAAVVIAAGIGGAYLWRRAGIAQERVRTAAASSREQLVRGSLIAAQRIAADSFRRLDAVRLVQRITADSVRRADSVRSAAAGAVIDSTRRALVAAQTARDSLLAYPPLVASLEAGRAADSVERATMRSQLIAGVATASGLRDRIARLSRDYEDLATRPPTILFDTVYVRAPRRTLFGVIPLPQLHVGLRLIGRCAGPLCADALLGW